MQHFYCTLLFDLTFEPPSWLANWKKIQVFTLWVLHIYKYTIYTYIYSPKSVLYTYEARRLHTRVSCVQALFKVITSVEFQSKFLKYQPTKIHQNDSNFVKRHALANIDYCCPLFMHFELNYYHFWPKKGQKKLRRRGFEPRHRRVPPLDCMWKKLST